MLKVIAAAAGLLMIAVFFVGVELDHREHETKMMPFIKQTPSPQVMFRNPFACGECDVEIFEMGAAERIDEMRKFCSARFGLNNLRACHAIFAERQRQVRSQMQSLAAIDIVAQSFINAANIENGSNLVALPVNRKVALTECAVPLKATWRNDADNIRRVNIHCNDAGKPGSLPWDISLPVKGNVGAPER
ncbi:hypothetical protein [Agrobacterium sp. fls2-241-TYG-188a]|uniref:hypothetical protein n=1 Tax=Agrobacterium sp. fls2-241-TYG-188a TaxID=3040275 RepID=UPI00255106D0|nr:hypothetical protein [Agrobacterium sp. fls2-241-TYG-188a]